MTDLLKSFENLSPQKRKLVLQKLQMQKLNFTTNNQNQKTPILPISKEQAIPLSFAQARLWFLDQLEPGSVNYNMTAAMLLTGNLQINAFEQALAEIIQRHEVLRTNFKIVNGSPVQVIAPTSTLTPVVIDLQALLEAEQSSAVQRLAKDEVQQPFNLANEPLLRVTLLKLGEEAHVLLLTMHHIVFDGWSVDIFIREFSSLYLGFSTGVPVLLPKLPIQYADFAHWQRQWLSGEVQETQLAYWKQKLAGAPSKLELPTDRPRPPVQTFRGSAEQIQINADLTQKLKLLSQQSGASLFMTLLAAFVILLSRYSGQSDIVVGSSIANRNRSEIEPLIGFFVNILVLRTDLSGNPTFLELLGRVRETCLDAYAHQDLPFEKLLEELRLKRDPSFPPLVQVAFVFQNARMSCLDLAGLTISPLEIHTEVTKTDITLFIDDNLDNLKVEIEYNIDLFEQVTITRMLKHFQELLAVIVSNQNQQISKLWSPNGLMESPLSTAQVTREELINYRDCSNLTEHQLLLWLGHKFNPDALIYNNALTFTIPTEIDLIHFQAAFQVLVISSDALRTVFLEIDGVPQQKVLPDFSYLVNFVDLSQVADFSATLSDFLNKRSQIVFDLEKCLFDTVLIKLSQKKFVWYINLHQIIGDGLSLSLIFNYLSELYVLSANNRLPQVVEIPQYQDYIDYERKYRDSARYDKMKNYWQEKLTEPIEPLSFYGKTPLKTTTFAHRVSLKLGFERTQKLKALAIQQDSANNTENIAIFNIFLALLAIYLYHISGNRKLVIGIPLHNRRSPAFKKTIGSFVQILPLHIEIEDTDNFQSLVKKIAVSMLTSLRYSQYVFRNARQNPVYDVVLNYITTRFIDFAGTQIDFDWIHTGHTNESLNLQIFDVSLSGNFTLDFDFNQDSFDEVLLDLAIQHFLQVLDVLLEDVTLPILQVNLLSPQDKQSILVEFNQTQKAISKQIFTQIFEEHVQKTPDVVAVVFEGQCVTYAQLNAQVNQLAHYLQSLGVKPEVLVSVYTDRSLEMLVAFLAILKAGGVYVPLDPAYPKDRLAYILSDSQVSMLLTQKNLVTQLPEQKACVVCLDADWEVISQQSDGNPVSVVTAENLAYVIYTSGSTGMPKGVMIEHQGMLNHLYAKVWDLKLTETDAIAQTAPQSFDISVWQLLVGLLVGGRVHIFNNEVVRNPAKLLAQIEQQGISILEVVPSLLQMMLQEIDLHNQERPHLSKLRWLILTGEALPPKLCDRWLHNYPTIPMLNAYGPTECSDDVTHYPIYEPLGAETLNTPIGQAVVNTQLYILNSQLQPVPIGVAGELYVGGVGVGRGYLNNPELTAQVFIPNPFGTPGTRLYKTGDKARYLSDGNIEFLGRIDYQVKIRGFRIELLEIEAVLAQHPGVRESVVMVWEQAQDKRLVGYVVPHQQEETPDFADQLRRFLKKKLPEYMIPSAFVMLESLPLTPNGKVDRRALPAPEKSSFTRNASFVQPRDSLELQLTSIWEQVLNVHRVGVQDNFFELGGHSLLALHMMAQIQQQLGKNLPLATLLQNPTIEQIASTISQHTDSQSWSPLVAIQPEGSKRPFFCVPGGAMDVIEFYHLARNLSSDQPFYGLQPRGLDGELEPHTRIAEMATCYIEAIQTIQPQGPYLLGGHSFGGYVAFEMAQLLQKQGHEVALLAILDVMAIIPNLNKPVNIDRDDAKDLLYFIRLMERFFEKKVEFADDILLTLDVEEQLDYLAERLKVANLVPPQIGTKQLRGFLKVSKATGEAFDLYVPENVYPSKISCFRASEVNSEDISSRPEYSKILQDQALGWNEFSAKPVEVHIVPGDHVTMMTEPHVLTLAERLQICIDKAQIDAGVV